MSEDLLKQFIDDIEREEGITPKSKKRKTKAQLRTDVVKRVLHAASRGKLELPAEESYIAEKFKEDSSGLDERLAGEGFSLVQQMRAERPADLRKRNVKYMKFTEKRKLDPEKARKMVQEHRRKKMGKDEIRSEREKITGLREPKKETKKNKSVFSEEDFEQVKSKKKKLKIQDEDGTFL